MELEQALGRVRLQLEHEKGSVAELRRSLSAQQGTSIVQHRPRIAVATDPEKPRGSGSIAQQTSNGTQARVSKSDRTHSSARSSSTSRATQKHMAQRIDAVLAERDPAKDENRPDPVPSSKLLSRGGAERVRASRR